LILINKKAVSSSDFKIFSYIKSHTPLSALPVFLEHFHRHPVFQFPDHPYGAFALIALAGCGPEVCEGHCAVVLLFVAAGKDQNRVTSLDMMDEVLAGF